MNAISHPLPESAPESATNRRTRQLDYFRRAADHAMRAIDIAAEQLEAAHATGEPGATASPTLDLARATRALVLAVNAENRVVAGQTALRAPASDRRRTLLRDELHKIAKAEPDPKRRATLLHDIDERIEDTLLSDPDAEIDTERHLYAIADQFHLTIDPAKLSDEIIGMDETQIRRPDTPLRPPNTPDDTTDDTTGDTTQDWDDG